MTRELLRFALAATGLLIILAGVAVGVVLSPRPAPEGPTAVGFLVVTIGGIVALVKALRSGGNGDTVPPPWTADGAIVEMPPEAAPDDEQVSGTALTAVVEAGGKRARREGSVNAGLLVVRSPLRTALLDALVQGGRDRHAAEQALADGSWTDDQAAAATLDEQVPAPERTFRRRLWAWLFPERAVRRRTARAVQAVATAADDALPPVVGQDAPRSVPVVTPTLDDLTRSADGRLERAETIGASGRRDRWSESQPPVATSAAGSSQPPHTDAVGASETDSDDADASIEEESDAWNDVGARGGD